MLETTLPDKKRWSQELIYARRVHKISKFDLCSRVGVTYKTLKKIMQGHGSYEQLEQVQKAIQEIVNEKVSSQID